MRVTSSEGSCIFITAPGKPAPVPTSAVLPKGGEYTKGMRLSRICFTETS